MTPDHLLEVTKAIIEATEFCFLITVGELDAPDARLMQPFEPEPDLTLWFGTSPKSRKVRDIEQNSRVTVAFQDAAGPAYAALSGTATIETNLALRRQYWREAWTSFFPGGPEGDDYCLVKFVPLRIELMHFGRNVAPEPYGLQPAVLVRTAQGWDVATGAEA